MTSSPSPDYVLHTKILLLLSLILVGTAWLYYSTPQWSAPTALPTEHKPPATTRTHPIYFLITEAHETFRDLLAKQTTDLRTTAQAYRKRRGRHPPPGFDKWFDFAQKHNTSFIIEEFFDRIYDDLNPFWGVAAQDIRHQAKHYQHAVSIKDGIVRSRPDKTLDDEDWIHLWKNLTMNVAEWLPDLDMPINIMDESRVIVPWDDINRYIKVERSSRSRGLVPVKEVITQFTGSQIMDMSPFQPSKVHWFHQDTDFWDIARVGCALDSLGRHVSAVSNLSGPPPIASSSKDHSYTLDGYIRNWTSNRDACRQPELRESHGTFIKPLDVATTQSLIPIFSGSKLAMNNDILLPAAMYWSKDPRFYTDEHGSRWNKKKSMAVWRGVATGGRNTKDNWTRFQRHRFVSMMNGTAVHMAERNTSGRGPNFNLPSNEANHLRGSLGDWLKGTADVGFVDLMCYPNIEGQKLCPYTEHYFELKGKMPMSQQYSYKFLPDIDGNSFSGRYRSFLFSTSMRIKATIYAEWHDPRLIPWVHFVPMHNSFGDIYGIMEYFMEHDKAAKKIALAGKEWAEKVLRREDMVIYVMRLLLEYARVCDDQREKLGFVADLKEKL